MLSIVQAATETDRQQFRELLTDYLEWGVALIQQRLGINLDAQAIVGEDIAHLEKYNPPDGCLLLAYEEGELVGCACVRRNGPTVAELKRMYVRPAYRCRGLGRALMSAVLDAARALDYGILRLDSPRFFAAAHALYRSVGFRETSPYPESEIPEQYRYGWVFMELDLSKAH